jgi:hypothetical protein
MLENINYKGKKCLLNLAPLERIKVLKIFGFAWLIFMTIVKSGLGQKVTSLRR